jgi:hypothetical protein
VRTEDYGDHNGVGPNLKKMQLQQLGRARRVVVTKDTTIIDRAGDTTRSKRVCKNA